MCIIIITVGTLSHRLYIYIFYRSRLLVQWIYSARLTCVRTNRRSMCDMINITSASLFIRIFSGTQFIQLLESTEVMKRSHGHNSGAQLWVAHFKDSRMEEVYRYSSQTSTSAKHVRFIWCCFMFLIVWYKMISAPPVYAPENLRGGGGSVGELHIEWDVSILWCL